MSAVERRDVDIAPAGYPVINLERGTEVSDPNGAHLDDGAFTIMHATIGPMKLVSIGTSQVEEKEHVQIKHT